ncbi:hypothetical protein Bca52824_017014, partial [Brassica carinata]
MHKSEDEEGEGVNISGYSEVDKMVGNFRSAPEKMAQLSVTKHVKSSEAGEVAGLQGVFYGECVLRELRREDQGFDEADFFTGFVSRGDSRNRELSVK